ncbi:glycoside hydrolase [Exidia glandulosa HHB12029]|uniref:glucan 1,3-beta-glucosidase n=1 Tax=Exidia glandulosa HHB12029 TaxID=1314781 RepID=A0A165MJA2_EXIGL|nr:glycoside hydrolase [Exidia glandulosa HHB12029]
MGPGTPGASTDNVHLRPGFPHRATDSAQSSPLIRPAPGPYYDDDEPVLHDDLPTFDEPKKSKGRKVWFWLVVVLVVLGAAAACVYFFVIKPRQGNASSSSSGGGKNGGKGGQDSTTGGNGAKTLIVGRDGDKVKMDNGTEFVYANKFGGFFIDDPVNPFNNGAKAQEWSPALNETWDYAKDIMRGGWLVLEPFIAPALYDKYKAGGTLDSDEWTLVQAMAADEAGGGIQQLVDHYETFITEKDFADIAGAGLNWIRLPIPYWAIEVWPGEPFLPKKSWEYALKAFKWARKYGLRVNLDLHTMPGECKSSQNGWNHSGKSGPMNWMNGVMGYANAQRSLTYMRIITEFISQKEYKDVVPIFGIVNEPQVDDQYLQQFYLEAYTTIRSVTGLGAGNGPIISIHDNFKTGSWAGFMLGADRLALDSHRYYAFDGQSKPEIAGFIDRPCLDFGNTNNKSMMAFGITAGGEWSLGFNDCGLYVNGGLSDIEKTTNCRTFWNLWEQYPEQTKKDLYNFALASMEGMHNFFFWTWKIGPSGAGRIEAPLWSYQLGLEQGWIPKNPREAIGHCQSRGVQFDPAMAFTSLAPSATGGPGAPTTLDAAAIATIGAWPPTSLGQVNGAGPLPSYTPTAPIPTLPPPSITPPATATLNGWAFAQDTEGAMTTIAGCTYPEAWGDPAQPVPAACPTA